MSVPGERDERGSGLSEALADVRADGHARPGAGGHGERAVVMLLVLLSGVPMLALAWLRYRLHAPSGDEPHYLIISQAIDKYGSLRCSASTTTATTRSSIPCGSSRTPHRVRPDCRYRYTVSAVPFSG